MLYLLGSLRIVLVRRGNVQAASEGRWNNELRVHRDSFPRSGLEAVLSGIIFTLAKRHAIVEYNSRVNLPGFVWKTHGMGTRKGAEGGASDNPKSIGPAFTETPPYATKGGRIPNNGAVLTPLYPSEHITLCRKKFMWPILARSSSADDTSEELSIVYRPLIYSPLQL